MRIFRDHDTEADNWAGAALLAIDCIVQSMLFFTAVHFAIKFW